jgi:hypothetical protein
MARPKPAETPVSFTISVPPSLRDAFLAAVQANDTTASQVLRQHMRAVIESVAGKSKVAK